MCLRCRETAHTRRVLDLPCSLPDVDQSRKHPQNMCDFKVTARHRPGIGSMWLTSDAQRVAWTFSSVATRSVSQLLSVIHVSGAVFTDACCGWRAMDFFTQKTDSFSELELYWISSTGELFWCVHAFENFYFATSGSSKIRSQWLPHVCLNRNLNSALQNSLFLPV